MAVAPVDEAWATWRRSGTVSQPDPGRPKPQSPEPCSPNCTVYGTIPRRAEARRRTNKSLIRLLESQAFAPFLRGLICKRGVVGSGPIVSTRGPGVSAQGPAGTTTGHGRLR